MHGMLLVGETTTTYLSHLPMFMSPHNYQALFEVTLTAVGNDPMALYLLDRKAQGPQSKMYSFRPKDRFVLTDLVSPAEHPRLSSFKGSIFRGHFESGHAHEQQGSLIPGLDHVVANVTNVILFRRLDPNAQLLPQLQYVIFGKGQELFLVHVISCPPDFDQILGAKIDGRQFTDEELRHGVSVTFPGRANAEAQKIKEREQLSGQVQVAAEDGFKVKEVVVQAVTEFYFETDDLVS
jgi:hypothetical protein